jgi:beta-glucosidase
MKLIHKLAPICIASILLNIMYYSNAQIADKRADNITMFISYMSLGDKVALSSGKDFWTTRPLEMARIPSIFMTDGPNGLRKSNMTTGFAEDVVPATCFPTASALAASWDVFLIEDVGKAIGEECQENNVQIILGPGVNIKRSPLCGRNFEYYSEDPILSGALGAAWVRGVQSQGVGASLKHFACNNQETNRMTVNVIVDERTLREIYLRPFEIVVKQEQPWTIMASYNRINGVFSCENSWLLKDVLRKEWGFKGFVVSDWGAVNNLASSIKAGMNLQMPGGPVDRSVIDAYDRNRISEKDLNQSVENVLRITLKADSLRKENFKYDRNQHHQLARKAASESIVLLKNENSVLPLIRDSKKKIGIIGSFAKKPRLMGGGSSIVKPTMVDIPYDEIKKIAGDNLTFSFTEGYPDKDTLNQSMIDKAVSLAQGSDIVVIFAGLPENMETEGKDRRNLNLPASHNTMISQVAAVQKNVIVVLFNGSPVTMPWLQEVKAVLLAGLGGEAIGGAIADVLFGDVNPSGKLAETYPLKLEDNPSYLNFPGEGQEVNYAERVFVGYRYYDMKNLATLFPFGYGLSYTSFSYHNFKLSSENIKDTDTLFVSFTVNNTGNKAGKEIVQLYVLDYECSYQRPIKELKAFAKVEIAPGETGRFGFLLSYKDFAFYNPVVKDWVVETGDFEILIGSSSQDIRLMKTIHVTATKKWIAPLTRYSLIREWMAHPVGRDLIAPLVEGMARSFAGGQDLPGNPMDMVNQMIGDMPILKLISFSQGNFTLEMLDQMIYEANDIKNSEF